MTSESAGVGPVTEPVTEPVGESLPATRPHSTQPHSIRLVRQAVRVLLCDPEGSVLLLRGCDPARPRARHWFTVGGGLEPGEDLVAAAIRETAEETGLQLAAAEIVITEHHDDVEFGFGQYWVMQHQQYVVAPAGSRFEARPLRLEPAEAATVDAFCWWSLEQLRAQREGTPHDGPGSLDERVYPAELPELLATWWRP